MVRLHGLRVRRDLQVLLRRHGCTSFDNSSPMLRGYSSRKVVTFRILIMSNQMYVDLERVAKRSCRSHARLTIFTYRSLHMGCGSCTWAGVDQGGQPACSFRVRRSNWLLAPLHAPPCAGRGAGSSGAVTIILAGEGYRESGRFYPGRSGFDR